MAKIVKSLQVSWSWTGDKYSLKGFNVAVTPTAKNPKEEVVALVYVETSANTNNTYTYKMSNVTLDKDAQYKVWVQAVYDNKDSDWVSTGSATVTDDGSNTIIVKTDREIQDIVNMASDSILTRQEKVGLRREWQEIVYEYLQICGTATSQAIPSNNTVLTNFKAQANALATYLNGGSAWTISDSNKNSFPAWINDANLGVNTSIVGDTYRSKFRAYYEAKVAVLEEIKNYTVDNIKIGGTNMLLGTGEITSPWYSKQNASKTTERYNGALVYKVNTAWGAYAYAKAEYEKLVIDNDSEYTLSFYAKKDSGVTNTTGDFSVYGVATATRIVYITDITTSWKRYSITRKGSALKPDGGTVGMRIEPSVNITGGYIHIAGIQLEKGNKATEWSPNPQDVINSVNAVDSSLSSFQNTVNTTFKDGLIETAEAKAIEQNLKTLESTKADMLKDYDVVYKNTYLSGSAKTNLASAKTSFESAHNSLISTINTVIADGRVTTAEKASVDSTFTTYYTVLGTFRQRLQEANEYISTAVVDGIQVGGANLAIGTNNGVANWSWSMQTNTGYTKTSETVDGVNCVKLVKDNTVGSGWNYVSYSKFARNKILPSTVYTISFEVKSNQSFTLGVIGLMDGDSTDTLLLNTISAQRAVTANGGWVKVWAVVKTLDTLPTATSQVVYLGGFSMVAGATHYIRNLQIEKGNKPTDWTPAVEDMENAYTIVLSNEAQAIPTSSSRVPMSSQTFYTDIQVYKGTTQRTDYSIATVASANGITVSQTSSRVNFAVSTATALTADNGQFVIPITIDGKTFNKTFSWAVSKQGTAGLNGSAGKGIKSITEYYLVSSASTGVTTGTSGWGTAIPTMTTTNRYLWNYEVIAYTDNTSLTTTPKVIGVYGNTGATGATGATGNGISKIENFYLVSSASSGVTTSTTGWSTTAQATTTTNKYLWNYEKVTYTNGSTYNSTPCIIGTHGATGATGASAKSADIVTSSQVFKSTDGGKTFSPDTIILTPVLQNCSYSKWQYSTNGSTWADVASGSNGLTIDSSTKKLTIAKTSALYTDSVTALSFKLITNDANIYDVMTVSKLTDAGEIVLGGANILFNGGFTYGLDGWSISDHDSAGTGKKVSIVSGGDWSDPSVKTLQIQATNTTERYGVRSKVMQVVSGQKFTISGYSALHRGGTALLTVRKASDGAHIHNYEFAPSTGGNNLGKYTRFETTFTIPVDVTQITLDLYTKNMKDNAYCWFSQIQLEQGNKATAWTPSIAEQDSAYSVILTNEAQVIPTNSSRVPTSSTTYYTDIQVYKGTTARTDYTIGTVNSANGITVSKTASRVNFMVSTSTALTADGGTFTIPITIDGKTFNKTFSWSASKQGATGATGSAGKGIKTITEYYLVSTVNTGVTVSTSGWSTTVPTLTSTNRYLWNYETITYTDNSTSSTAPKVIGVYGDKGSTGATGATGATGNGIKSITNYYLVSANNSGITTATSGWTTTIQQTTTTNKYLWNYEIVAYTNGTNYTSTPVIIGTHGATGATGATGQAGTSVKSVDVEYYLSTSATTLTGGSWSTTAPSWVNGKYMWSRTKTTLSSGTVTYSQAVCITGQQGQTGATGSTGATGTGISSITEEYYLSTSKTAQTGGSWTTTPPTWSTGKYLWTRSKIVYTNPSSTKYTTPLCDSSWEAVNEIEIGSRNLLRGTSEFVNVTGTNSANQCTNLYYFVNKSEHFAGLSGKNITVKVKYKVSSNATGTGYLQTNGSYQSNIGETGGLWMGLAPSVDFAKSPDGYFEHTLTMAKDDTKGFTGVQLRLDNFVGTITISEAIIVEGNKITNWSQAPEDVQEELNNAVAKVDVMYYLSTSQTSLSGGSWSTTAPTWVNGKYMWQKTVTTLKSGATIESNPTCIAGATGANGSDGKGVKSIVEQYYHSTSMTAMAGGSWSTTAPTPVSGKYIWTRSIITYTDNTSTTTSPICTTGATGATGATGTSGGDAYTIILSNEAHTFQAQNNGNIASAIAVTSKITAYKGATQVASSVGAVTNPAGLTVSASNNGTVNTTLTITATAGTSLADSGTVTIPITVDGKVFNKQFSWSKSKAGATGATGSAGASAKSVDIMASSQTFKSNDGGITYAPDTIVLTPALQNCTYSNWQYSTNGGSSWTTISSGSNGLTISGNVLTISKSSPLYTATATSIVFRVNTTTSNIYDTMTVSKLTDAGDVEVGGRNLIRKSYVVVNSSTGTFDNATNTWTLTATAGAGGTWGCGLRINDNKVSVPYGRTYVLSFEIKVPRNCSWNADVNNYAVSGSSWGGNDNDNTGKRATSSKSLVANQWVKCWIRYENTNTLNTNKVDLYDNTNFGVVMSGETSNMTFQIRNVKGELGTVATDWTPSPEDVAQDATDKVNGLDSKLTQAEVFKRLTSNGAKQGIYMENDQLYINGTYIKSNSIHADKIAIGDFMNYCDLTSATAGKYGFTVQATEANGQWLKANTLNRDVVLSPMHTCNGGESFRLKGDISTTVRGLTTSGGSTVDYRGVSLGIFAYDGTGKNVGYLYATRVQNATSAFSSTVTLPTTARSFRVYLQTEGWGSWSGETKVRNLQVLKMNTGDLIVNGSISANQITSGTFRGTNFIAGGSGNNGTIQVLDENNNVTFESNRWGALAKKITIASATVAGYNQSVDGWVVPNSVGFRSSGYGTSLMQDALVDMSIDGIKLQYDTAPLVNGQNPGSQTSRRTSVTPLGVEVVYSEGKGAIGEYKTYVRHKEIGMYYSPSTLAVDSDTSQMKFDVYSNRFRLRIGGSGALSNNGFVIHGTGDTNVATFTGAGATFGNTENATEKQVAIGVKNTSMTGRCGMYINTTNFGLYDWQNSRHVLQYNQSTGLVNLMGRPAMTMTSANGYYGFNVNGNTSDWIRTSVAGLIPYASGGNSSSLGTDGWAWKDIWGMNLYAKSKIQVYTGYGTNLLLAGGTGDSINYGTNNMRTRCHWGWGISDNNDSTNAVIDSRAGRFIGKSAYWHNSSKSLKSDVRAIVSENEPMVARMFSYDTIDTNVTMEMIEDFLDTINIKTYVSDYNQEGVTQEEHDDSKAHITQLGYIADEFASHPMFKYIGEMIGDYHAINTTALISAVIAGYQMEKRRRVRLEYTCEKLEARLAKIEATLEKGDK